MLCVLVAGHAIHAATTCVLLRLCSCHCHVRTYVNPRTRDMPLACTTTCTHATYAYATCRELLVHLQTHGIAAMELVIPSGASATDLLQQGPAGEQGNALSATMHGHGVLVASTECSGRPADDVCSLRQRQWQQ